MQLPAGHEDIARAFPLSETRKAALIAQLKAVPEDRANAEVSRLINEGGLDGRFVAALFERQPVARGESPHNKKINPPNR